MNADGWRGKRGAAAPAPRGGHPPRDPSARPAIRAALVAAVGLRLLAFGVDRLMRLVGDSAPGSA